MATTNGPRGPGGAAKSAPASKAFKATELLGELRGELGAILEERFMLGPHPSKKDVDALTVRWKRVTDTEIYDLTSPIKMGILTALPVTHPLVDAAFALEAQARINGPSSIWNPEPTVQAQALEKQVRIAMEAWPEITRAVTELCQLHAQAEEIAQTREQDAAVSTDATVSTDAQAEDAVNAAETAETTDCPWPEALATLLAMGIAEETARARLTDAEGDPEKAIEFIFV